MKIRFFNGHVMTMNKNNDIFTGEVHTDDDVITYVGGETSGGTFDREVDMRGGVIMPGFKDCHCHSPMTLFRNYADDLPLDEWLNDKIFPLEAKLDGESVYWGTLLAVLEYLSGGVTAVCDMYFWDEWLVKAMADGGMRCVFVKGMSDNGNFKRETLDACERNYLILNELSPLVRYDLGVHAEYTASRELLKGAAELSAKLNAPVSIHLSESKKEVEDCVARYGDRPAFEVAKYGVFDRGGMAYHCVYLNDDEIALLAKKGVSVVTNPASNLKLANGVAPLIKMLEAGVNVALGTDGPASNNGLDMFREMYLASVLQKSVTGDPAAMPAETVLKMATVNGAMAMRLYDCDCLAEGKQADMTLINLDRPNTRPLANLQKSIVFSADRTNVRMTVVAGRILYEDGEFFTDIPADEIYRRCEEIAGRFHK